MTSEPREPDEREALPVVSAVLVGASRAVGSVFRRVAGLFHAGTWLKIWAGVTVFGSIAFALIAFSSPSEANDLPPLLRAIGAGFSFAFLSGITGIFLFFSATSRRSPPSPEQQARAGELNQLLAPTLRELGQVRSQVIQAVKARSVTRVPLAMAAGFAIWLWGRGDPEAPGLFSLLLVSAIAGEAWASYKLGRDYRRLYKDRVLPLLAAQFGDLTYRRPSPGEARKLLAFGVVREKGTVTAEDEFVGTYRGLPLSIIEASVTQGAGDDLRTLFDGLLVSLELPRALSGTTVIGTDRGWIGNLKEGRRLGELSRVRLEDPHFERHFEVYGSDQIEARALLTPAFMERFVALARDRQSDLPGAWAEGRNLVVALPKRMGGRLFEPPGWWKPVGGSVLVKLTDEIAAVLAMADSVIALDFWATGRAGSHSLPGTTQGV